MNEAPELGACTCYGEYGEMQAKGEAPAIGFRILRCPRCLKRDELWPELVEALEREHGYRCTGVVGCSSCDTLARIREEEA